MVRGKWRCDRAEKSANYPGTKFTFEPVSKSNSDGSAEDVFFSNATPTGKLEMFVNNPAAEAQFELGKYYYFDATAVPVPAPKPEPLPTAA